MKAHNFAKWVAITGMGLMLTAGCSDLNHKESQPIDPPPTGVEGNALNAQPVSASVTNPMTVTIYARDENNLLAPIAIEVEKTESVAKRALEYMVEGGPSQGHIPSGFSSILPKGTEIKGINIDEQKVATVDFSSQFTDYNIQDERKILEAVTWTLTGFPTIDYVKFRVEGHDLKEMPHNETPLDEPLSRAMGINLEKQEGIDYGQTTPVTLYFLSQNQAEYKYYVPVTRLIARTSDVEQAVIEQLIAGPDEKKGLMAVMMPGAELLGVNKGDEIITVNFSDSMLGPDHKAPEEALDAIVLSLTENAGSQTKVHILVNGEAKVETDGQSYSKPVSRPASFNQVKL